MQRLLFTLMSLACSVVLATTTVYKWVDENGVIHYSDQPHPNAEKIQVQGVQTYSASSAAVRAPSASAPDQNSANPYRGCAIAQPLDQQTLANVQSVFIRVQTDPGARPGDRVFITMDGQALNGGQPTGMGFNVTPVDRGEHTVQAQVRGPGDEVVCQTPTVTFFVRQPNLFNPANSAQPATNPRPR